MTYVLTHTNGLKLIISKQERDAVLKAVTQKDKAVLLQDNLISLAIVPTIMPFDRWYSSENERLALTNKRICKKCLSIMDSVNGCACWKKKGVGAKKNAFLLPGDTAKKLAMVAERMTMPDADPFEVEFERVQLNSGAKPVEYDEKGGALGYKDPETGETMYS